VESFIAHRVRDGQGATWSEPTTRRVAQGVLATLRDFGVLTGVVKKRLAPFYVPIEAFAYVAFLLYRESRAAHQVAQSPEWRLYLLHPDVVERMLFEAHQERLLSYQAAGRVVRLDFPAQTLPEYARALAHRAY